MHEALRKSPYRVHERITRRNKRVTLAIDAYLNEFSIHLFIRFYNKTEAADCRTSRNYIVMKKLKNGSLVVLSMFYPF